MYILHVTYEVKEGMRGAFLEALKELDVAGKSRAEKGNFDYTYYLPLDDENAVFLTEIWDCVESQKAHCGTEHFLALGKAKDAYVKQTTIKRFEGSALPV